MSAEPKITIERLPRVLPCVVERQVRADELNHLVFGAFCGDVCADKPKQTGRGYGPPGEHREG